MTQTLLAVALGGALGSVLRFLVSAWTAGHWPRHAFLATFSVNLLGCLLIGIVSALFVLKTEWPLELRDGLKAGFLGGLTTFSAFSLELVSLLETGRLPEAAGYLLFSIAGGLLAAWLGLWMVRVWA